MSPSVEPAASAPGTDAAVLRLAAVTKRYRVGQEQVDALAAHPRGLTGC